MTKLREAQQNYKDKIGAKQRSFRHTNSILVSCDEKPEDLALDACLSQVTAERKHSLESLQEQTMTADARHNNDALTEDYEVRHKRSRSGYKKQAPAQNSVLKQDGSRQPLLGVTSRHDFIQNSGAPRVSAFTTANSMAAVTPNHDYLHQKPPRPKHHIPHQVHRFTPEQIAKLKNSRRSPRDLRFSTVDQESMARVKSLISPPLSPFKPDATGNSNNVQDAGVETIDDGGHMDYSHNEKLNRLKDIHESSQSFDVIYI